MQPEQRDDNAKSPFENQSVTFMLRSVISAAVHVSTICSCERSWMAVVTGTHRTYRVHLIKFIFDGIYGGDVSAGNENHASAVYFPLALWTKDISVWQKLINLPFRTRI